MSTECAVCKRKLDEAVQYINTPMGDVCCGVCQDYVNEQVASGKLDEAATLNEVQLLL